MRYKEKTPTEEGERERRLARKPGQTALGVTSRGLEEGVGKWAQITGSSTREPSITGQTGEKKGTVVPRSPQGNEGTGKIDLKFVKLQKTASGQSRGMSEGKGRSTVQRCGAS